MSSRHWRLVEIDGKTTDVFTADAIDENNYADGTNAWIGGDESGSDDGYVWGTTAHLAVLKLASMREIEAVEIVPPGMLTSQEKALARELGDAIEAEFAKPRPVILAEIQYTIPELVISGADVRQP